MKHAMEELEATLAEAEEYCAQQEVFVEDLRLRIEAISEDVEIMERRRTADPELEKASQQLAARARRTKRSIERQVNALLREKGVDEPRNDREVGVETKSNAEIKFSKISMPTFDGNPASYQEFADIFEKIIQKEKGMTDLKKWLLLKQNITGRAAEMVAYLPLAEESYHTAMQIFKNTFAGKRRAITSLTHQLEMMPTATLDTWSLRLTYSRIEGILITLEKRGENAKENPFLTSLVMSKYPEDIRLRVIDDEDMLLEAFQLEVGRLIRVREGVLTKSSKVSGDNVVNRIDANKPTFAGKKCYTYTNSSKNEKAANESTPKYADNSKQNKSAEIGGNVNKETGAEGPARSKRKNGAHTPLCIYCEKEHWSDECPEYATINARKNKISDRCVICLKKKHEGVVCIRQKRCIHCQENTHHRSLCPKKFGGKSGANAGPRTEFVAFLSSESGFFTLMLVVSGSDAKRRRIRAVIDTAGGRTLITEELAVSLNALQKEDENVILRGVGREPTAHACIGKAAIKLYPPNNTPIQIKAQVVDYITDDLPAPDVNDVNKFRKNYPECNSLLIPETGAGAKIDLLLGRDCLFDVLTLEKSMRIGDDIQLMSTVFGWLLLERDGFNVPEKRRKLETITLLLRTEDAVKRLWEMDCVGLKEIEAVEVDMERKALEKFYTTIKYVEGRYEVAWPYIENEPNMQNNFGLALGQLRSLHKKLRTDPHLLQEYDKLIRQQICDGITEPVETARVKTGAVIRYIPHQAVVRPGKSTLVRIVYDASAKCGKADRSLNEQMIKGLNWVPDLPSSLIRFRRNVVAVTADIERAFHQISIREEDRDAVRYLWVKKLNELPEGGNLWILRFKRMAFGIIASPFLLAATIKYHLRSRPYKYAKLIELEMYADNLVISLDKQVVPYVFYKEAKIIFEDMSMNLSKWATQDDNLAQKVAAEDIVTENEQLVLGMKWFLKTDELSVKAPVKLIEDSFMTKRKALRELASVFDPMGWVAPATLLAKLFIRELWESKCSWDANLAVEMEQKWRVIASAMRDVETVRLPRKYFDSDLNTAKELSMHVFVDASKQAYAAVIYLTAEENQKTMISFVAAKNRLAPRKTLTVPRLELLAMFMGCRYAKFVIDSFKVEKDIPLIVWTDSKCVLAWVSNNKLLPSVIEKQVIEIKRVDAKQFMYVPSQMNPADILSRGASIQELKNRRWWAGPEWLRNRNEWPAQELTADDQKAAASEEREALQSEERMLLLTGQTKQDKAVKSNEGSPFSLDPNEFSTLSGLLRRTEWCLFCLNKLLEAKTGKRLINEERLEKNYAYARRLWLRWDQKRRYPQAYVNNLKLTGELKNLRLFVDSDNVLRCETRIMNATLPEDTIKPILLVRGSSLTKLIIMNAHLKSFHAGMSQTLAEIRKTYWLPRGRQHIYTVIKNNCMTCKRYDARPFQAPETLPLPEFRVRQTNAVFECVGMDVFGPFLVRENQQTKSKRRKVWVMIFTCLVVRAVHMEVLQDMTSQEFLFAFKRYVARRGVPKLVVTDNAPQFHVLEGKFQRLWQALENNEDVSNYFAVNEIKWEFIPQTASWMGGVYERLIRSAKNAFERTYGRIILWTRQFEVVVFEVEAVMNSRPLTYVGKENDARIITPNNFLKIKYAAIPVRITEQEARDSLGRLWKVSEDYLNQFWREWADHYIAMIRDRNDKLLQSKGISKKEPERGDIVLMIESDKKRSSWTLARIEELVPSADNKNRSALIKLPNGAKTIRPLIKLAPIHLQGEVETGRRLRLSRQRTAVFVEEQENESEEEVILGPDDI